MGIMVKVFNESLSNALQKMKDKTDAQIAASIRGN